MKSVWTHSSTKWMESRETLCTDHNRNIVCATSLKFRLRQRIANGVDSQICPCLNPVCLGQDWLWLYSGETKQSGFLEPGAWLWWRTGCSMQRSPERGQSSAEKESSSKLANIWTEPASGPWKKSDPLTTHTLKVSLEKRNTILFYESQTSCAMPETIINNTFHFQGACI